MAKFGQAFINQLTNPSYSQGMFNLGATVGSAPAVAAERKSKEERQKGLLGGLMAVEQAAQQGSLTDDMLKEVAGSLSGLGLPADKVMGVISNARQLQNTAQTKKEDEKEKRKALEMRSSLGEDFVANADQRLYDEDVIRDVSRRIAAGQITDLFTALESAQNQTVEKNKQDYYSTLSNYNPRLNALIQRGEFKKADKVYADLKPPEKKKEADETLKGFYAGGGVLTSENRQDIFKAVSYSSKDINEAITTMNSLETQSAKNKAAQYTGPKQKIAYIPKGEEFSFETGSVDTKTIDAPIDPKTGEIQKEWLDDFLKFSAKRIIGMGDRTPEKENNVEDGQVNGQPPSGNGTGSVTPRNLLNNLSSTAY